MGDGVYGVTEKGFVPKRLDQILASIFDYLSLPEPTGWGVDPRIVDGTDNQNLESAMNILITSFGNEIAALWENGQDVYNSVYPNTASDTSLDNAVQFGGVERGQNKPSVYPLLCTGVDGTSIPYGSLVQSTIAPIQQLQASSTQTIGKANFTVIKISTIAVTEGQVYSTQINGTTYSYTAAAGNTATDILNGIKADIEGETSKFDIIVTNSILTITDAAKASNALVLSANLQVNEVSSRIFFSTLNFGNIQIPLNTITNIVSSRDGWTSVTNDVPCTPGQIRENDVSLRQAYTEEMGGNSDGTVTGVVANLKKLAGVTSVIGFRNNTGEINALGMQPHSLWFIVDGGDEGSIAQVIFEKGAGGINTNGTIEVSVIDDDGNAQPTRFDRPTPKYVWLHVELTAIQGKVLPSDYETVTKETILNWAAANVGMGKSVYIQQCYGDIYRAVANLALVVITAQTTDSLVAPATYPLTNIPITQSQKAVFSTTGGPSQIEVVLP
jgi:uncharacterized phage protein gp47/JayE